jgi:hypothetical protein
MEPQDVDAPRLLGFRLALMAIWPSRNDDAFFQGIQALPRGTDGYASLPSLIVTRFLQ